MSKPPNKTTVPMYDPAKPFSIYNRVPHLRGQQNTRPLHALSGNSFFRPNNRGFGAFNGLVALSAAAAEAPEARVAPGGAGAGARLPGGSNNTPVVPKVKRAKFGPNNTKNNKPNGRKRKNRKTRRRRN